jgi:hypothetical protein
MAYAIYELEATGENGAYEATGDIHFYCSLDHAERHAIAEGFRTSANYSKPTVDNEYCDGAHEYGTQCEWCGDKVSATAA